jgi:hypothetical protein
MEKARAKTSVEGDISLIVPVGESAPVQDRWGGELQSGALRRLLGFQKIEKSPEAFNAGLEKLSDTVYAIAAAIESKNAAGLRVSSVEVGLAITAEGSIGIATAGVEATVTVTLERK